MIRVLSEVRNTGITCNVWVSPPIFCWMFSNFVWYPAHREKNPIRMRSLLKIQSSANQRKKIQPTDWYPATVFDLNRPVSARYTEVQVNSRARQQSLSVQVGYCNKTSAPRKNTIVKRFRRVFPSGPDSKAAT